MEVAGIKNNAARKAVRTILEAMREKKGYTIVRMNDEEGNLVDVLGGTEREAVYFRKGTRRGWIVFAYEDDDVVVNFGGDGAATDIRKVVEEVDD